MPVVPVVSVTLRLQSLQLLPSQGILDTWRNAGGMEIFVKFETR
jgi:hypothetical protein